LTARAVVATSGQHCWMERQAVTVNRDGELRA